jgi:glutaredoxin
VKDMIRLYSTGCPRCNVLKKKLDESGLQYEIITDTTEIARVLDELKTDMVPILSVDEDKEVSVFMAFPQAVKWVGEQNK